MYALYASGIGKRLGGFADNVLVALFIAGFLLAIIAAGLIGNRLRRLLWRMLLPRR
jgi:ABC-type multidrug transport system permease subunit